MGWEFEVAKRWMQGKGVDVGCGTDRLSPDVLAVDQQPDQRYAHADVVHDCNDLEASPVDWKDQHYDFADGEFDFIFSSHCLEDFSDIPAVLAAWWKKLKVGGYMILLLPDMEGGRYPKVGSGDGNPSHKTDVGLVYIVRIANQVLTNGFEIVQADTLPHDRTCSIDIVLRKVA